MAMIKYLIQDFQLTVLMDRGGIMQHEGNADLQDMEKENKKSHTY